MRKNSSIVAIVTLISIVASVVATFTALYIYNEKKRREDEELERYLDNSIL